jgi:membrane protein
MAMIGQPRGFLLVLLVVSSAALVAIMRPFYGTLLWALVIALLFALGMVMGLSFLLMVSLVFSAVLAALEKSWSPWFGDGTLALMSGLNVGVSLLLLSAVFAMIYKWMPRVRVAWSDVWIGAFITALLFTAGKGLIGLYIGRSGVPSAFGAAASLMVLLLWVYWSAQIFLLGAEFTWVWSNRYGSRRGAARRRAAAAGALARAGGRSGQAVTPLAVSAYSSIWSKFM